MRWLSALGGLTLLFGTLYVAGPQGLAVIGSLIVLIAAIEFGLLFESKTWWLGLFLFLDIFAYLTHIFYPQLTGTALVTTFIILSSAGIIFFRNLEPGQILAKIQWTLWGILYTAILPSLTVHLLLKQGWIPLIYLLVTVFVGDVAAFFCGRYIGGPKILPNISPKKTVSGAIGGLIASGIAGAIFLMYFSSVADPLSSLLMSLTIGFFAQIGDFFESLIKRVSGCKDSGQLMPGHGGFLDRLDGVYFGSAVFYVFCVCFNFISYF